MPNKLCRKNCRFWTSIIASTAILWGQDRIPEVADSVVGSVYIYSTDQSPTLSSHGTASLVSNDGITNCINRACLKNY
jgi:hypothetical protein